MLYTILKQREKPNKFHVHVPLSNRSKLTELISNNFSTAIRWKVIS